MGRVAVLPILLVALTACSRPSPVLHPTDAWFNLRPGVPVGHLTRAVCGPVQARLEDEAVREILPEYVASQLSVHVSLSDTTAIRRMEEQLGLCVVDWEPRGLPRSFGYYGDGRVLQWRHVWFPPTVFRPAQLPSLVPSRDSLTGLLSSLFGAPAQVTASATVWNAGRLRIELRSRVAEFWVPEVRIADASRCAWVRSFLGGLPGWPQACP